MKLYDYECTRCNTVEERLVKAEIQFCSKCGYQMNRLISAPAMVKTNMNDKTGFKNK